MDFGKSVPEMCKILLTWSLNDFDDFDPKMFLINFGENISAAIEICTVHFDDDGLKFNKDSVRWFSNVKRLNDVVVRQDDSTKGQVSVQVIQSHSLQRAAAVRLARRSGGGLRPRRRRSQAKPGRRAVCPSNVHPTTTINWIRLPLATLICYTSSPQ